MGFLRIAASAAIFTVLSAVCATAKPITTTGETNLRKSPGTDSPVLTIIPKGTTLEVGKCSNGWCETSSDGQNGYVIARNLGLASAPRPRPAPQVYDEAAEDVGSPVYGPRVYAVGPPAYYGYRPYYGYGPYYGYYGGWWGHRGWGWRW